MSAAFIPTTEQLAWMQDEMAAEFPHLTVSVEWRDEQIYVEGLPKS